MAPPPLRVAPTEELSATLTLSREYEDILVVLVSPVAGTWLIVHALDEDGHGARLTKREVESLVARAEAGEDETGA